MNITNKHEWWEAVDNNWTDLKNILKKFLPLDQNFDINGRILQTTLEKKIESLKSEKDNELKSYFHSAWFAAPDQRWIRQLPGWSIMCDLCSEDYVLNEDSEV